MHYGSLNKTYLKRRPPPWFPVNTSTRRSSPFDLRAAEARRRHLQRPEERQLWQAVDVAVTCPDWWQTCSLFLAANIWESKEPDTQQQQQQGEDERGGGDGGREKNGIDKAAV